MFFTLLNLENTAKQEYNFTLTFFCIIEKYLIFGSNEFGKSRISIKV